MYFNLFSTCIIVEGYSASLIYDLDRMDKYDVPKHVGELLLLAKQKTLIEISREYGETEEFITDFFTQFVNAELGFFTATPKRFPDISFDYASPYTITNAIIEVDKGYSFDEKAVFEQLNALGCRAIQLVYHCTMDLAAPSIFLECIQDSRINQVEFLIPYSENFDASFCYMLADSEPRISRFLIYAAPEDNVIATENARHNRLLIFRQKDIREDFSEIISPDRFTINIEIFTEAQTFNTGLHRKVCIDKNGNIRNYPNHKKIFGNTGVTTIRSLIKSPEFQLNHHITNDMIEICKICQFRYCCVSNSDIILKEGKYFKETMCDFDPVNNTWIINQDL
jgi:SPASM domain peptide maturase of grasp-with-spasm system